MLQALNFRLSTIFCAFVAFQLRRFLSFKTSNSFLYKLERGLYWGEGVGVYPDFFVVVVVYWWIGL